MNKNENIIEKNMNNILSFLENRDKYIICKTNDHLIILKIIKKAMTSKINKNQSIDYTIEDSYINIIRQ